MPIGGFVSLNWSCRQRQGRQRQRKGSLKIQGPIRTMPSKASQGCISSKTSRGRYPSKASPAKRARGCFGACCPCYTRRVWCFGCVLCCLLQVAACGLVQLTSRHRHCDREDDPRRRDRAQGAGEDAKKLAHQLREGIWPAIKTLVVDPLVACFSPCPLHRFQSDLRSGVFSSLRSTLDPTYWGSLNCSTELCKHSARKCGLR